MAIERVEQKSNHVVAYNDKGKPMFSRCGSLISHSANELKLRVGRSIFRYNDKGTFLGSETETDFHSPN